VTDAARATAYRRVGAAAAVAFLALLLLGLARHVDAAQPTPASPQPSLQQAPPASAAPTEPRDDDHQGEPHRPDGAGGGFDDRGRSGRGAPPGAGPATPTPAPSGAPTT
jgi:hypothetical protein